MTRGAGNRSLIKIVKSLVGYTRRLHIRIMGTMRKVLIIMGAIIVAIVVGVVYIPLSSTRDTPPQKVVEKEKPLAKYSYPSLHKTVFSGSKITVGEVVKDEEQFTSYIFSFSTGGKNVSGLMNVPKKPGDYPVIIMIRGYVPKEMYEPGMGTSHGGEVLAQNGFITLAPDFLGYGSSDKPSPDAMEDRFLTYTSTLELISSLSNLNSALESQAILARYDGSHLGIWGHSNGGQIALSVLEITGMQYPTVLWAPVSKPFPYSILYYTDDIDDHGKALRKVVANFEKEYDAEKYSLTNYLDWIEAPIQIHQGGADEAVPQKWSDTLVESLKQKEKSVEYFTYPGDDHNFSQGNWNTVMQRSMAFYQIQFAPKL